MIVSPTAHVAIFIFLNNSYYTQVENYTFPTTIQKKKQYLKYIVIYEMSARRYFSGMRAFARTYRIRLLASMFVQYFLKRTLCLIGRKYAYPL
jgi:hypothetical protein